MQSLYIESPLPKYAAAEVTLPEDANAWSIEILQELYKQVPYVADFSPHVVMDKVDGEQGYGFGQVIVQNKSEIPNDSSPKVRQAAGIKTIRIPVIIRSRKLCPFDVMVLEDTRMVPLTETRLRQNIFRPQFMDVTSRAPGDTSIMGQLFPPYRQNYGMGGGIANSMGMGKMGEDQKSDLSHNLQQVMQQGKGGLKESIKRVLPELLKKEGATGVPNSTVPQAVGQSVKKLIHAPKVASLLQMIEPTIRKSDQDRFVREVSHFGVQSLYDKNASACYPSANLILRANPTTPEKLASQIPGWIQPTVVQVTYVGRAQGAYEVKTASHRCWMPHTYYVDRRQLLENFGAKVASEVDQNGSVTVTEGPNVKAEEDKILAKPITSFGLYKVKTNDNRELIGFVFTNLLDLEGNKVPVFLFSNGSESAFQANMVGEPAGEGKNPPTGAPKPNTYGVFFHTKQNGDVEATVPLLFKGSGVEAQDKSVWYLVEDDEGMKRKLVMSPHTQAVVCTETMCLLPGTWSWMPLGENKHVVLMEKAEDTVKQAHEMRPHASLEVRFDGASSFSFSSPLLEKFAYEQKNFLNLHDALFLLGGFGTDLQYASEKLGEAMNRMAPVTIRVGRAIKTAQEQMMGAVHTAQEKMASVGAGLKVNLVKEAGFIPDPIAVDTVLSLGFLNPDNLGTFISYLPQIEETQSKLCELLVASRCGLTAIPTGPLEKAVKSVESTLEGLKTIAFQEEATPPA